MGRTVSPGPNPLSVTSDGQVMLPPEGWIHLPPGDPALTRRVKLAGEYWQVEEKLGRRTFSRGVWAPETVILAIRRELDQERATPAFAKKREADARRREQLQTGYVLEFLQAVKGFLKFHESHSELEGRLAQAVTDHATPVGSGTVARTRRIAIEERAEAAVIAWMRHQTTGYDGMKIPKVKGKRREIRRILAGRSQELLDNYRKGLAARPDCPLAAALAPDSFPKPKV